MINVILQLLPTLLPVMSMDGQSLSFTYCAKDKTSTDILLSDMIHVKTEINCGSMLWQFCFA